jgi:5-formyltetrahydrofolate cyclo-ligase
LLTNGASGSAFIFGTYPRYFLYNFRPYSIPRVFNKLIAVSQLRADLRFKRRSLSQQQHKNSSARMCELIGQSAWFKESQHIACYLANDGEIKPEALIAEIWKSGKLCYLPVLAADGVNILQFAEYTPDTQLSTNRFGITEPVISGGNTRLVQNLDLICLPLVAFDDRGNRMGMGKGFYDRTLAFLNSDPRPIKPKLLGLAHGFQKVDKLTAQDWDVPLNAIATEKDLTFFD